MVAGDVVNTAARLQSRRADERHPRRRGDVPRDAARHRLPRPRAGQAKGKAEPVPVWEVAEAQRARRRRRARPGDARSWGASASATCSCPPSRASAASRAPQLVTIVGVPGYRQEPPCPPSSPSSSTRGRTSSNWRRGRSLPYGQGGELLGARRDGQGGGRHPRVPTAPRSPSAKLQEHALRTRRAEDAAWLAERLRPLVGLARRVRRRATRASRPGAASPRLSRTSGPRSSDPRTSTGRRGAARLRRRARRLGRERAAARRRDGAARALRPPAGVGRRQAQRARRSRLRRSPTPRRRACSRALLDRTPAPGGASAGSCSRGQEATRCTPSSSRACSPSAATPAASLPETVQGIIAARLDSLTPAEKELLQDAAVLGRSFWPGALGRRGRRSAPALVRAKGVHPPRASLDWR